MNSDECSPPDQASIFFFFLIRPQGIIHEQAQPRVPLSRRKQRTAGALPDVIPLRADERDPPVLLQDLGVLHLRELHHGPDQGFRRVIGTGNWRVDAWS